MKMIRDRVKAAKAVQKKGGLLVPGIDRKGKPVLYHVDTRPLWKRLLRIR